MFIDGAVGKDIINLFMGSFIFKRKEKNLQPNNQSPPKNESEMNVEQYPPRRRQRNKPPEVYNPAPIFKKISANKMNAINDSWIIKELINSQNWLINPEIIEHLRILNVFQCIQASNALTLTVSLFHNVTNLCTTKMRLTNQKEENQNGHHTNKIIIQQYSQIYASLLSLQFLQLRKLVIKGQNNPNDKEAVVSLEVLQFLDSPCLEQLHADGHNLTSIKFLKKCHWRRLTTLSLRETKISDSAHFADVLPSITNSKHIETLNLASRMSGNWYEISWLLKMGFSSADVEKMQLDEDDDYYFANNEKVLRRVEFGINPEERLRRKHISMIRRKFNNSYFDNPLVLW